ncbi:hypothetical protein LCGC14_2517860 [marine sediment metagenome]|uniref:Uncharacterized protein n=1 Tax=marine sediment metagenome TaxID=412755 RepID=A0A0F9DQQ1_9ZZZZ
MITVTSEVVVTETFGLIELDFYIHGMRTMIRIPTGSSSERIEVVRKRANATLRRTFLAGGGITL